MTLLAYVVLIVLHNAAGDEVSVNPDHIVALSYTREGNAKGLPNQLVVGGAKCVISLSNGKMVSVIEGCGMIRQAINEAEKGKQQ